MPGVPFEKGNSGRPKGSKNRNTTLIRDVFAQVFDELQGDPKASLKVWAKANPTEFYKLSAKLIPIQVGGDPDNPIKATLEVVHIHTGTPIAEKEEDVD